MGFCPIPVEYQQLTRTEDLNEILSQEATVALQEHWTDDSGIINIVHHFLYVVIKLITTRMA